LQIPGWLLVVYLVYGQVPPAFNYELGVAMGTQDSAARVTAVGVAFWYGFALADTVFYIPIFVAGLIGVWKQRLWGRVALAAALGITVYWPVVVLTAAARARSAPGWNLGDETAYWIVLPAIALWALWGLWRLAKSDAS
jgi:hypothetical protein